MEIRLLGPLEVWCAGEQVRLGSARLRAVLATLALENGRVVAIDRLVDVVWGDDPPATANSQLHTSVWQLRQCLGDVVETRPPGYLLRLEPGALDVENFERRLAAGRTAAAEGRVKEAAEMLRAALLLWRGRPLADVPALAATANRLEDQRLTALEARIDADLVLGAHADLVSELTTLTAQFPLRERLHGYLMTALYRSGRAADALAVYRQLRDHLANELGLEPMPELHELQQQILTHAPTPTPQTHSSSTPTPDREPTPLDGAPETRYVNAGGIHIAYQVLGEGGTDVLLVPGLLSHLDLWWEDPVTAEFHRRLAGFGRLIVFDKRGTGLSDRPEWNQTLEDRMDDLRFVMDAAGSSRAVLLGYSEGGPMSILYAATYPERVSGLVLAGASARWSAAEDYPCGRSSGHMFDSLERIGELEWGRGSTAEWYTPSVAHTAHARWRVARRERLSVTPNDYLQMLQMVREIDVRAVLGSLQLPVLVVQRLDDRVTPPCHGRYLAAHLPNARYVEHPGDHAIWIGDTEPFFTELEDFITGRTDATTPERVLATVLVVDVVGTDHADAADGTHLGGMLDPYPVVSAGRGRLIERSNVHLLATFDGPARAIRSAISLQSEAARSGIRLRAGLHVGEAELPDGRPTHPVQALTTELTALGKVGEVVVSRTVKDLVVGSGLQLAERGTHAFPPDDEEWSVYAAHLG
jgi:DNA-binding SARP family transcriptional activator/pimeloyl-ACP methyl ester carboxylesterase